MTAQAMENLYQNGEWRSLATLPLKEYLYCTCAPRPKGEFTTAHMRGYVGSWEIRDSRLYLVGLDLNYVSTQ